MTQKEREKLTARIAKERGFTVRELAQLGRVVDAAECRRLRVHPAAEGFAITYPGSKMVRVRYFAPRQEGQRYGQPANMLEAYYCPLLKDWPDVFKNVSTPLVITEGEFKAATACQLGVPCIGLGGVFNFASQRLGLDWLPSLERVVWQDRKVAIVFDSDAVANPMVQLAETRLALRLMERGAEVYIVRLPYDGAGLKQGLDDYIRNHGADALAQLLKQAKSCNPHRALHALNAEIVYVEQPNSVVRISDFLVMGTRDFRNDVYADRTIPSPDGKKIVSAAQEWMRWPQRNKASGLTFEPGGALFVDDAPRGRLLNTWRGWPMEPVKGSVKPYLELHKRLFGDLPPDVQRWV